MGGGRKCAVYDCVNSSKNTKIAGCVIHLFPNQELQRSIWIKFINESRGGEFPHKFQNFGICSLHFNDASYKTNSYGSKNGLLENAIPINANQVHHQPEIEAQIDPCDKDQKIQLLTESLNEKRKKITTLQAELKKEKKNNANLSKIIEEIKKEKKAEKEKCTRYFLQKMKMKRELYKLQKEFRSQQVEFEDCISKKDLETMFTATQISMIKSGKTKSVYTNEDYSKSLSLFCVNSRAYDYLRKVCKYPLISKRSLQNYLKKILIRPGAIEPSFNIIKSNFCFSSSQMRQAILCFDEVAISPYFCYDQEDDIIYGEEDSLLLASLRGLFYDWRQPVYVMFGGKKFGKDQIVEIITKSHENSVDVVGMVSDNGSLNVRIWNQFGIKYNEKISYLHPVTSEDIFVLSDFSHCIKLIRKALNKNKKFLLNYESKQNTDLSKNYVDKEVFEKLLSFESRNELRICHKLTPDHLNEDKFNQNVRKAFEMYSHSVEKAIEYLGPYHKNAKSTSEFVGATNNWADVMNSGRESNENPNVLKRAYGCNLKEQDAALEKFQKIIQNMRVGKSKSLSPFQKGIILSIKSLQGLYLRMRNKHQARYIETRHLTQDYVESGFSRFRSFGSFNLKPDAVDSLRRIRKLLVCHNFHRPQNTPVTIANDDDGCLSARLLKNLIINEDNSDKEINQVEEAICSFENEKFIYPDVLTENEISDLNYNEKCLEGAYEYLAGYLVKKCCSTEFVNTLDETSIGWIKTLSNGNLVQPSLNMISIFKKLEDYFNNFHGSKLNLKPGVMKNLVAIISKYQPGIPSEIINFFVKTRTHIRIKTLNKKMENDKYWKYQVEKHRKSQRLVEKLLENGELEFENNDEDFEDDQVPDEFCRDSLNTTEIERIIPQPEFIIIGEPIANFNIFEEEMDEVMDYE